MTILDVFFNIISFYLAYLGVISFDSFYMIADQSYILNSIFTNQIVTNG